MELDARDIVNHIRLARAYIKEKGLEVFLELAQNEPERAVKELPKYIEKVLNMNEKEYNSIVELGFRQAKKFSWEECSKKTLKVIENIND